MQLKWGNFGFDVNGASVSSSTDVQRSESGRPVRATTRFDVEALILGTGDVDLTNKENAIRSALAVPYQDLVLYRNDGKPSGLTMLTRNSLSGVVITSGPNFVDSGKAGEYVRFRTVRFSGEATYLLPGTQAALISFRQTVSVQGNGGPVRRWRIPVNAAPVRQVVSPYSIVVTTQSGQAVGNGSRPNPPPPFFGRQWLVNEAEAVVYGDPKPVGSAWVEWPVSWNYRYETPFVPVGLPGLPFM